MLNRYTENLEKAYRPYDFAGTVVLSADKTGKSFKACLIRIGSGGYLEPGVFKRIPE